MTDLGLVFAEEEFGANQGPPTVSCVCVHKGLNYPANELLAVLQTFLNEYSCWGNQSLKLPGESVQLCFREIPPMLRTLEKVIMLGQL